MNFWLLRNPYNTDDEAQSNFWFGCYWTPDLGTGTTVTPTGLVAHRVETHLANWFLVV